MELDFSQPGSGEQEKVVSGASQEGAIDLTPPPVPPPVPIPPQETAPQPPTELPTHPPQKAKGHAGLWIVIIILVIVLGGGAYYFLMTDSGKSLIGLAPKEQTEFTDLGFNNPNDFETDILSPSVTLNTGEVTPETSTQTVATPVSRDTKRKADLAQLQTAIDLYRTENGSYPISATIAQVGDATSSIYTALVPKFVATIPTDPLALDQGYWYGYRSDTGATAYLTARLEETTDPSVTLEDGKYIYHVPLSGASSASQPTTTTTTTLPNTTSTTTTVTTP